MRLRRRRHLELTSQGQDRHLGISLVVGQLRARIEVEEHQGDGGPVVDRYLPMSTADGCVLVTEPCRDPAQVEGML
jgi:hypothetical protein